MKRIGIIPYFFMVFLPLLGFIGSVEVDMTYFLSTRVLSLFGASVKLGLISATICVIVGLGIAIAIRTTMLHNKSFRWFFLAVAPVPYYIYALSFMYIVRFLMQVIPDIARGLATGLWSCICINILAFLPITTGLLLMELEHQDIRLEQVALLYKSEERVLWNIILPNLMPMMLISGILVFALTITDYSVPSLFQYNTYTLEIFSAYSKGLSFTSIGVLAAPLVLVVFGLTTVLVTLLKKTTIYHASKRKDRLEIRGTMRVICLCLLGVSVVQIVLPVLSFMTSMGSVSAIVQSIMTCKSELFASILIAATSSFLAVSITFLAMLTLEKRPASIVISLALLPIAIPSSLIAIGLLSVINGSIVTGITQTFLFPALGCAIKYMPFVFIMLQVYKLHLDWDQMKLARCLMPSRGVYLHKIILPMYRPILITSFAVAFLLSFGDESIGLILMPPGYQTLAVMIYNYLHYGASELVSGFCFVTMISVVLIMTLSMYVFKKEKEK